MANILNDFDPNFYVAYVGPIRRYSIERDPFLLLIEEVIDYSLWHHNLHGWNPPVDLDFARSMNAFTYFNENFAATVISRDIETHAILLANRLGFDEERWLEFIDHEEARRYQEYYLLNIYNDTAPFLFQAFSFACFASRIALQRNRGSLISDVVWSLLAALREILPIEEYYREFRFAPNLYNNQHINYLLHDADEGIGGIADGDLEFYADPILLFVEELIDYSLRYDNLDTWTPPIDLETLRRTEIRYFTENLGRAIAHSSLENDAVREAQAWGFNEETWLELCRPEEARNFHSYFLLQVWDPYVLYDAFLILSFACYCSKLAMRRNRNGLVYEVVVVLVCFLRHCYPLQQHYWQFDDFASMYNNYHLHLDSSDDGIDSVERDVAGSEENNEADFFEEEASSLSDGE